MSETVKIIRAKPGLIPLINGVQFIDHERGSISEPISAEKAADFLLLPGYEQDAELEPVAATKRGRKPTAEKPVEEPVVEQTETDDESDPNPF